MLGVCLRKCFRRKSFFGICKVGTFRCSEETREKGRIQSWQTYIAVCIFEISAFWSSLYITQNEGSVKQRFSFLRSRVKQSFTGPWTFLPVFASDVQNIWVPLFLDGVISRKLYYYSCGIFRFGTLLTIASHQSLKLHRECYIGQTLFCLME